MSLARDNGATVPESQLTRVHVHLSSVRKAGAFMYERVSNTHADKARTHLSSARPRVSPAYFRSGKNRCIIDTTCVQRSMAMW